MTHIKGVEMKGRPLTDKDIRRHDLELARAYLALQTEFLQPLIKRTFDLMRERGLIPPEPVQETDDERRTRETLNSYIPEVK